MHGDLAEQALDLVAVDRAGAEVLGRLGPAGDAVGEAVLGRAALVAGGDVAGQEGVAGADRGDRLERLGADLEQAPLGALADRGDAAVGPGDRRLAGAEPDQLGRARGRGRRGRRTPARPAPRPRARSGSPSRRRRARPASIASPSASSTTGTPRLAQVVDQARVEVVAGAGRQRAGEHADLARRRPGSRSARRAASTSSGLTAGPRSLISVCSPEVGSITARLIRVSAAIRVKSVSTDSSRSCSSTRVPVGPPTKPVAITGRPSRLSARATLIPLPPATVRLSTARWRRPRRKFGHRDGAVDRRVEGHGEDHLALHPIPLPRSLPAGQPAAEQHRANQYHEQRQRDRDRVVGDEAAGPVEGARLGDRAAGAQRRPRRRGGRRRRPSRGRARRRGGSAPRPRPGASTSTLEPLAAAQRRPRRVRAARSGSSPPE